MEPVAVVHDKKARGGGCYILSEKELNLIFNFNMILWVVQNGIKRLF